MAIRISSLQEVTEVTGDDLVEMVDVSDTTMAASGTNKKIKKSLLSTSQSVTHVTSSGTITYTTASPFEVITESGVTRTLPVAPVGWEGYIMSDIDATVKLAVPSAWHFEYPSDTDGKYPDGRPVISKRGGVIKYVVTAPNVYTLYGDFAVAKYGWHPTDSSNLIGVWQAGLGHNFSSVGRIEEGVATSESISTVWGARWGNGAIFYTSVDYQTDLQTFGPQLTTDATLSTLNYSNPQMYAMSNGSNARLWKCSTTPGTAFTMYMLIRQVSAPTLDLMFIRMSATPTLIGFGLNGGVEGLAWEYDNSKRYIFTHANSVVAWPTKGASGLELTTNPILLSVELTTGGSATIYSGNTLVSDGPTGSASFTASKLEIIGGLVANLGGFAILNGVPASAAERTQRQNYFTSLFS